MKQRSARVVVIVTLLSLFAAILACASGGSRQLQSITASASGQIQIQFTATGTFTGMSGTVTSLPVSWYTVPPLEDPPFSYSLTSQPFTTSCQSGANVIALAPTNPNAATTGPVPTQVYEDLIVNHTRTSEGGFVASSPTYIACP